MYPARWNGSAGVAMYLTHETTEKPGQRRRLVQVLALSLPAPLIGIVLHRVADPAALVPAMPTRLPLDSVQLLGLAGLGIPTLLCLAFYWRRLRAPHRINTVLAALLAPWDARLTAMFAMVAAVLLAATVFRQSVDWPLLRPAFKHAEWHYFWCVATVAIWVVL